MRKVIRMLTGFLRRGKVQWCVMHLAYYAGIINLFYYLNRHAKRVIVFHNVLPDSMFKDDMTNCASCSVTTFERIISMVEDRFPFSTDFDDPKTVTVTFDDGLLNQYEVAGAILRKHGIPAVVFASGKALSARSPKNCSVDDQLLFWTAYAPDFALEAFAGGKVVSRIDFWIRHLRPAYAADVEEKGELILRKLDSIYPFDAIYGSLDPEFIQLRLTGLTKEALEKMKANGWKLGWHTQSHFPLSSLSDSEAWHEICPPNDKFRETPFCFPYGETASVSERDVRIAKEVGYPMAFNCSMKPDDNRGKYFAIRFTLPSGKIALHYVLSGMRYFMESGKLLIRNTCNQYDYV